MQPYLLKNILYNPTIRQTIATKKAKLLKDETTVYRNEGESE